VSISPDFAGRNQSDQRPRELPLSPLELLEPPDLPELPELLLLPLLLPPRSLPPLLRGDGDAERDGAGEAPLPELALG
jgi:hypothetical protein